MERRVKIVKLSGAVPQFTKERPERNKSAIFTSDIAGETEILYQRFAPGHMGYYHVHQHAENIWLVLKGTLLAIIGGVRYQVHEGEIIFMPATVPHATGNASDNTEMHALEIYAPPIGNFEPTDSEKVDLPADIRDAQPARA